VGEGRARLPRRGRDWFAAPRGYATETLTELVEAVHADGARVAVHTTSATAGPAYPLASGDDERRADRQVELRPPPVG
jgi:hypothetical protein